MATVSTGAEPPSEASSAGARVQMPPSSSGGGRKGVAAHDPRRMRRIIAEDPEWNVPSILSLVELSLATLCRSFAEQPVLDELPDKFKATLLASLDVALPLSLTAGLISDEGYWRRCCEARWDNCSTTESGGSWKRFFCEHNLRDILEQYVPGTTDPQLLQETLRLTGAYVVSLDLRQLLPRADSAPEAPDPLPSPGAAAGTAEDGAQGEEAEEDDGENAQDDTPAEQHLNFDTVFSGAPNLEALSVQYKVRDCGMDFKWSMFGMTRADCSALSGSLQQAFRAGARLSSLSLQSSLLDDSKVRVLVTHLLGNTTLQRLDLSHNRIADRGARALAKLLHDNGCLRDLDLADNQIHHAGGHALGMSLRDNTELATINLRMNRLGDAGGQAFLDGLHGNGRLEEVNISGNELGRAAASSLASLLRASSGLKHLDLTCNDIGDEGGQDLLDGMQDNTTLRSMDMRLCQFEKETELAINELLHSNLGPA